MIRDATPVQIITVPEGVSRRRKHSSPRQRRPIHTDLSGRRARRGLRRLAVATVCAATIAFYDGLQIHIDGHPSGFLLASAVACALLAQGWTTSRSIASVRWFFVGLLTAAAILSFAGFTLVVWPVDGALFKLPLSLVLAAIASWVAGSSHLRELALERATSRERRVARRPRAIAGVLGGVLVVQSIVILAGYSRVASALVLSLILVAIAFPPLYLAAVGKNLTLT